MKFLKEVAYEIQLAMKAATETTSVTAAANAIKSAMDLAN